MDNKEKFVLAIFVSIVLVLSSSLLVFNLSPSSGNSGTTATPAVSGGLYNVSFKETGLTTGLQWNVSFDGTYGISTTSVIVFQVANGTHTYTVANLSGFSSSPSSGSVTVSGSAVSQAITFTKLAPVVISPVNLGTAGQFTILAKTGISTTGTTSIVGNIGVSPAGSTYITGFSLIMNSSGQFSTSSMVNGRVYAATYASPTPSDLTTAVSDMQTAYTNAAGRVNPNYVNLGAGNINGMTLVPGLYKWGTGVSILTSVTLTGNSSSVWIFQISGGLTFGNGAHIVMSGGAQASNIFWQVASGVSIGTGAAFDGIVLSQTAITIATGSSMTGIALAQTAVTLQADNVTAPTSTQYLSSDTFTVSFAETGLPSGTTWYLNMSSMPSSGPITLSTYTVSLTNGSYSYTVSSMNQSYHASSGTFSVNGKIVSVSLSFSKTATKTPSSGLSSTDLYLIVGVVVALAIVGTAVGLMMKKRGSK